MRPGQSAELLDVRTEEYRAACKARDVRLTRDPNRSHRVMVDVVRRDPLAPRRSCRGPTSTAGLLSIWDPVAFGVSELGRAGAAVAWWNGPC